MSSILIPCIYLLNNFTTDRSTFQNQTMKRTETPTSWKAHYQATNATPENTSQEIQPFLRVCILSSVWWMNTDPNSTKISQEPGGQKSTSSLRQSRNEVSERRSRAAGPPRKNVGWRNREEFARDSFISFGTLLRVKSYFSAVRKHPGP